MWDRVADRPDAWVGVRAYRNGDVNAFLTLQAEHQALLLSVCRRRHCRNPNDAVDEVWYQVLRRIHEGRVPEGRTFASWICGICLNVLRAKGIRTESTGTVGQPSVADSSAPALDPATLTADSELHDALRACLDAVDERLRTIYRIHYFEEAPLVEVARRLKCSEANVRQKLRPKLLAKLRACLARKGFGSRLMAD